VPGKRGKRGFRLKLPVIPPDALFNLRFLGITLTAASAFTLVSLLSPGGTLTQNWAAVVQDIAGWAAAPWCVLAIAAGLAMYHGRKALRRAILGRLAGATLILVAAAAVHQLTSAPLPDDITPVALSKLPPASDGYIGLYTGAGLAVWFGVPGAVVMMVALAIAGFGLLCGWSLTTWQMLAWRFAAGAKGSARGLEAVLRTFGRVLRYLGRLLWRSVAAAVRGAKRSANWMQHRYARWSIARAQRAEAKAAAREAAARERAAALATLPAQQVEAPAPEPATDAGLPILITATEAIIPESAGIKLGRANAKDVPAAPMTFANGPRSAIQWQLPSTSMLSATSAEQISEAEIAEKKRLIERTLGAFNVPVTVKEARIGPRVTQFLLRPGEGISVKKIKQYEADLQLVLAAQTLRIELPVPGRPVVGIEIPNSGIETVGLREMLESPQFHEAKGPLRLALGRDVDGKSRVGELTKMPHLLIAGQTGSGKSFCVNSIICSLLFQCTPDELNLLMIDPKMVEMAEYEGVPHLKYPVVVDLAEAGKVLLWAVAEMERRYRVMAEAGFRHIDAYNKSLATAPRENPYAPAPKPFSYLVIIIDELADLMMFAPDDVEPAICRLTAKARAVGIHLVVATQRPSVDVVTGLIKANMPSRIAFAVASQIDSRVILDMGGAESLLGRGDMLYLPYDQGKPLRAQGTYMSDEEISKIIHFWKKQGSPQYVQKDEIEALRLKQEASDAEKGGDKQSSLVERAVALLQGTNYTSISHLQRKLGIGYPRAARLLDDLEERGLVEADETNGRSYKVIHEAVDDPAQEFEPVGID
jgi:DNA segregation ATPase FtsK/SpoIIIE-like protein